MFSPGHRFFFVVRARLRCFSLMMFLECCMKSCVLFDLCCHGDDATEVSQVCGGGGTPPFLFHPGGVTWWGCPCPFAGGGGAPLMVPNFRGWGPIGLPNPPWHDPFGGLVAFWNQRDHPSGFPRVWRQPDLFLMVATTICARLCRLVQKTSPWAQWVLTNLGPHVCVYYARWWQIQPACGS